LLDPDRVMKQSELDDRPVPIAQALPELTPQMQQEGGNVTVSLVVGKDGVPIDLKIVQASNPALAKVCLAAAAKWRFKPGALRGKPVKVSVVIPFRIPPQS
jgi:TonB family protein